MVLCFYFFHLTFLLSMIFARPVHVSNESISSVFIAEYGIAFHFYL